MAFEVEFSKRLDLFGAEIFAALNDKKVALEAQGEKAVQSFGRYPGL